MSSSYYGEPNIGIETSTRKEKKSNNSDKPKQSKRGLGVAQLEKIRLETQLGSSYLLSPHETFYSYNFNQMEFRGLQSESITYANPQPSTTYRWNPRNGVLESNILSESSVPSHSLNLQVKKSEHSISKRNDSMWASSNQIPETSDSQELDLELRLSV